MRSYCIHLLLPVGGLIAWVLLYPKDAGNRCHTTRKLPVCTFHDLWRSTDDDIDWFILGGIRDVQPGTAVSGLPRTCDLRAITPAPPQAFQYIPISSCRKAAGNVVSIGQSCINWCNRNHFIVNLLWLFSQAIL